jgi:SAM-dependent methyltransferase
MAVGEGYLFDNRHDQAGQRFAALAELFDPATFRRFDALGLASGHTVWEVGAGGPTVPRWLAHRVAPGGRVLATDIDPRWLDGPGGLDNLDNLDGLDDVVEVRRHDVGRDRPPEGPFDVVHARLLLVHVPEREQALAAMASVLRPGGWLLVEEADPNLQPLVCPDEAGPAEVLANRLKNASRQLLLQRGVDLAYGRTLPRRLRELGLVDVAADTYFPLSGPACTRLEHASVTQIRDQLITAGLATAADIDAHLGNLAAAQLDLATSPLISAWGRRPLNPADQGADVARGDRLTTSAP